MSLNKEGMMHLADDLLLYGEMYNQSTYGDRTTTSGKLVCCLASLCLRRAVGAEVFEGMVAIQPLFARNAAALQLGIPINSPIFGSTGTSWPCDLDVQYRAGSRVVAALKALQRLREDGTIDPNPDAVHTPIPQLEAFIQKPAESAGSAEQVAAEPVAA